jgi:hypothetical protein
MKKIVIITHNGDEPPAIEAHGFKKAVHDIAQSLGQTVSSEHKAEFYQNENTVAETQTA